MNTQRQTRGILTILPIALRPMAIALAACTGVLYSQGSAAKACSEAVLGEYKREIMEATANEAAREAVTALESAAIDCNSPPYWQALGDAQRLLSEATQADSDPGQIALEAYGNAFSTARAEQDDKAGAQAARSIADLGLENGDPLKAQNWLIVANRLDPEHPELPDLQSRLDAARDQLSANEIDTGLSQTRGIGTVNSLLGGKVSSNAFWDPEDESSGGSATVSGSVTTPTAAASGEVTIDIPIRFDSNSTELTGETAENVRNLAGVLSTKSAESRVALTGHADVRGDADYNQALSLARAEAIRDLLISAKPGLKGRIDAIGAGETSPIDLGDSPRSHANNRRLEVSVIAPDS